MEETSFLPHDAMRCLFFYHKQIVQLQTFLMLHGSTVSDGNAGRLWLMYDALVRLEAVLARSVSVFRSCGWVISA